MGPTQDAAHAHVWRRPVCDEFVSAAVSNTHRRPVVVGVLAKWFAFPCRSKPCRDPCMPCQSSFVSSSCPRFKPALYCTTVHTVCIFRFPQTQNKRRLSSQRQKIEDIRSGLSYLLQYCKSLSPVINTKAMAVFRVQYCIKCPEQSLVSPELQG